MLTELVERLERAEGPSRELDWAITLAVATATKDSLGKVYTLAWLGDPNRTTARTDIDCPHFTASLDAALSLIPKGHCWQLKDGMFGCEAIVWTLEGDYDDHGAPTGTSAGHPALALCIAALHARREAARHERPMSPAPAPATNSPTTAKPGQMPEPPIRSES